MGKKGARIKFTDRVTRLHGAVFADGLVDRCGSEALGALGESRVMKWPSGEDWKESPAQDRYNELADEILDLTFAIARDPLAAAFVVAASEIIERERAEKRGKRKRS